VAQRRRKNPFMPPSLTAFSALVKSTLITKQPSRA
jgi:hypothetical protein